MNDAQEKLNQFYDKTINGNLPKPYVGMPATYCIGGDSYATKIETVTKGLNIVTVILFNQVREFTLRKNGRYMQLGSTCGVLRLGEAIDHLDPNF